MTAVVLDYELSKGWNQGSSAVDLQTADETTLRYCCFLGDVVFEVGKADFSARWGWVPVLDFALGLRAVVGGLVNEPGGQRFEFTESDSELALVREGSIVRVEANYAPDLAEVPLVDLSIKAERFLARVIRELERTIRRSSRTRSQRACRVR